MLRTDLDLDASAAMSVCAMPVGQDVTATIIFMGGYLWKD